MEASLTARDRVGIQDFVLLDAYTSESAFLDNLRKRFHENLIYVSPSCAVSFFYNLAFSLTLIKHHALDLPPVNVLMPHSLLLNVASCAAETAAPVLFICRVSTTKVSAVRWVMTSDSLNLLLLIRSKITYQWNDAWTPRCWEPLFNVM